MAYGVARMGTILTYCKYEHCFLSIKCIWKCRPFSVFLCLQGSICYTLFVHPLISAYLVIWHRNAFCMTGALRGDPPVMCGFLFQMASSVEPACFWYRYTQQLPLQVPWIWGGHHSPSISRRCPSQSGRKWPRSQTRPLLEGPKTSHLWVPRAAQVVIGRDGKALNTRIWEKE